MGVNMRKLYLGSQSKARQKLLDIIQIPYEVIAHTSTECDVSYKDSFQDYVLSIAQDKMAKLPTPKITEISNDLLFLLTADTLMRTANTRQILGKPQDIDDAKRMLKIICNEPIELVTACVLVKKEISGDKWVTIDKEEWVTPVNLEFCVDEESVDLYLKKMPQALNACGAGIVEDFGLNFLKKIDGSFTAVLGLPLFELRKRLKKLGF
jgi:septum formation protein